MNEEQPRLLPDEPSTADSFGGHERIAASIADLVETRSGGYAIALEGDWGAGKSTVIAMLQQRLSSRDEVTFVFDAWAHQGDPLRRSFLEELALCLAKPANGGPSWVSREDHDEVAKLSGSVNTTDRTTTTKIRFPAKAAAFGALLVPIGLVLLNYQLDELSSDKEVNTRLLVLGIVLSCAPVLFGLLGGGIQWLRDRKGAKSGDVALEAKAGLFDPFVGNQTVKESSKSSSTVDPTSVEFERVFRDIVGRALNDNADRRLVIVLDNLDRISPDDGLSIISTMQTFLGSLGSGTAPWRERLWVVVPYDQSGLGHLWRGQGSTPGLEPNDDTEEGRGSRPGSAGSGSLALEQIDKLFRVTFRVPPLILADWQEYAREQLAAALPGETERDRSRVVAVLSAYHSTTSAAERISRLTPRKIKRFVNEIVALRMQYGGEVDLVAMAAFVLVSRYEADLERLIDSRAGLPNEVENMLGADAYAQLAQLRFGLPASEVSHIFLAPEVESALTSGDSGRLLELLKTNGVWEVICGLPYKTWWSAGGSEVGVSAMTLSSVEVPTGVEDRRPDVFFQMRSSRDLSQDLFVTTEQAGRGIARLLVGGEGLLSPGSVLPLLCDKEDAPESRAVLDRARGLTGFVDETRALHPGWEIVPESVYIATSTETFVELASFLTDNTTLDPSYFFVDHSLGNVDAAVAEMVGSNLGVVARAIPTLRRQFADSDFPLLQAALIARALPTQPTPSVPMVVTALRELGPSGVDEITEMARNGSLHHHFYVSLVDLSAWDDAAALMVEILEVQPELPAPSSVGFSMQGHAELVSVWRGEAGDRGEHVLAAAAGLITDERSLDWVLGLAASASTERGVAGVVTELARRHSPVLSADAMARHWGLLTTLVGSEALSTAAAPFQLNGALEEAAVRTVLEGANASLALAVVDGALTDQAAVVVWTNSYLNGLSDADWELGLRNGYDSPALLIARFRRGIEAQCGVSYETALSRHIVAVARAEIAVPERFRADLPALLASLEGFRQVACIQSTLEEISKMPVLSEEFAETWGPTLVTHEAFYASPSLFGVLACAGRGGEQSVRWAGQAILDRPTGSRALSAENWRALRSDVSERVEETREEAEGSLGEAVAELLVAIEGAAQDE